MARVESKTSTQGAGSIEHIFAAPAASRQNQANYDFRLLEAPGLSQSQRLELKRVLGAEQSYPLATAYEGRTFYPVIGNGFGDGWPSDALKIKGARGLRQLADNSWQYCVPEPNTEYLNGRQVHVRVNAQLDIAPVATGEKTLYTLSLPRAQAEFHCQNRLAAVDLGFPGVAYCGLVDICEELPNSQEEMSN